MKCLVCKSEIDVGEQVFYGTQMVRCGPGKDDYSYSEASGGFVGGIHLSCLERPVGVVRMPDMVVPESVESLVVSRSDALGIFKGE